MCGSLAIVSATGVPRERYASGPAGPGFHGGFTNDLAKRKKAKKTDGKARKDDRPQHGCKDPNGKA